MTGAVPQLARHSMTAGWQVFRPNRELRDTDIPAIDAPVETHRKSPSQRLYNVLYRVWEQRTNQTEPFDSYYIRVMERLIERYKQELT